MVDVIAYRRIAEQLNAIANEAEEKEGVFFSSTNDTKSHRMSISFMGSGTVWIATYRAKDDKPRDGFYCDLRQWENIDQHVRSFLED